MAGQRSIRYDRSDFCKVPLINREVEPSSLLYDTYIPSKGRHPRNHFKGADDLNFISKNMGKGLSRLSSNSRGNSPAKVSSSNNASSSTLPQVRQISHTLKDSAIIDCDTKAGYRSSHPTTALLKGGRTLTRRNSTDSGYNSCGKIFDCRNSDTGGRRTGLQLHQHSGSINDKTEKIVHSGENYNGIIDLDKQNKNKPRSSDTRTLSSKENSRSELSPNRHSSLSVTFGKASLENGKTRSNSSDTDRSMISRSPKVSSDGLVGLQNLGNTCFMNSILQCLSHCKPLRDNLVGNEPLQHNALSKMKGKLVSTFVDLIKAMWSSRSRPEVALSPHSFKLQIQRFSPRFVGYEQQDSQEFLRFLLDGLHEDLNHVTSRRRRCRTPSETSNLSEREKSDYMWKQYKSRDNSLITDLFCGQMNSTLTCTKCHHESVTFDPFWDLSLSIPKTSHNSYSSSFFNPVTLVGCLKLFTKIEELDGDEKPKCEKCKVRQNCRKQFKIQTFPRILVLHLKRFSGFGFRSKLQTDVDFPLNNLDMSEFASHSSDSRSVKYNLFAVSNHSGSTYGGHYTAYCKHPDSKEWHSFNDSRVGSLSNSSLHGSQAYVLFYEMEDVPS